MSKAVSVVVPAYNTSAYLENCLRGLLGQTFAPQDFEIILVDDGSTDNTLEKARWLKQQLRLDNLVILHQENAGPAAARNAGIRQASADIIAFLDCDCVPQREWLEKLVIPLQDDPLVQGVEGRTIPASEKYTILDHYIENRRGGVYWTCNIAYRAQTLKRLGGFDEGFPWPAGEDIDLAHRVKQMGEIAFEPQAVVAHLILSRSFQSHVNRARLFSSMIRLWKKHPGLLVPEGAGFGALVVFQLKQFLLQIITQRRWLWKNPQVYVQLCAILVWMSAYTLLHLPAFYQEARQPLVLREPLT